MLTPQLRLTALDQKIIVDLFAGGGGMSVAMEMAWGRSPDIAINHNEDALSLHQTNHPQTEHYVADVYEVCPKKATAGRPVGWLHLSPDCTHFSQAKGGQPRSSKIRALEILEIAAAEAAVCGGDASGISRVADWMRVMLGTAAWADVPDATAWVEDLRGDDDGQQHATESLLLGRILAMWNNGGETSDLDDAWLQDAVIASGLAVQGDKRYVLTPRAMELIGAAAGKQR